MAGRNNGTSRWFNGLYSKGQIIVILFLLTSCSALKMDTFQKQSCVVVYCESSESNKTKAAALKLLEITAATQGADLKLGRGFCEEYYTKRALDYRYSVKSAEDVCQGK